MIVKHIIYTKHALIKSIVIYSRDALVHSFDVKGGMNEIQEDEIQPLGFHSLDIKATH